MIPKKYAGVTGALPSVALLLIGCALTGCARPAGEAATRPMAAGASPSSSPEAHYAHLFGKRYRTRVDLYLFVFTPDSDDKYLGRNSGGSGFLSRTLPAAVSRGNIGRTYGTLRIVDIVPAGSELTLRAETHEVTPFSGIQGASGIAMGFICSLAYDGKQMDDVLSEFIQSHQEVSGAVPNQEIDAAIATRVPE